jgi:hypothetical protein
MEISEKIFALLCLSMTVSVISLTVTKAVVFRWLRNLIKSTGFNFLYELFTCPFCFSYYVTAFVFLLLGSPVFNLFPTLSWVGVGITYFTVIGIAAIFTGVIFYLFSLMED